MNLLSHGQYKNDLFTKLNFNFAANKKILDVGCGNGSDAVIFINDFELDVYGIDVYEHDDVKKVQGLKFQKASVYNIPFADETFDYVFLHDVLHHIDEENQSRVNHLKALNELSRVLKTGGQIIIVEGNRYNPLFYPHMVLMKGHNHWRQSYFKGLIKEAFNKPEFNFSFGFFEAHLYPEKYLKFWKLYEFLMEKFSPKAFLAYNISIINKS